MKTDLTHIAFYGVILVQAAIAVWSFTRWRQSSIPQRLVIVILVITPITGIVEFWLSQFNIHNLWISHLANLVNYNILVVIFFLWKLKKSEGRWFISFGIAFNVLWMIGKFTFEPLSGDDVYSAAFANVTEIIMGAMLLFNVLRDSRTALMTDARAWIASGTIIYSSGTLLLFALFSTMLDTSPELIKAIWPVNWALVIIATIIYARGIWCPQTR